MLEMLEILFYVSVITFCGGNLIFLLTPLKASDRIKVRSLEGEPYPPPYQPPNKVEKPKGEDLPIHRHGDWVYDPNVNYRPRNVVGSKKKLTRLS